MVALEKNKPRWGLLEEQADEALAIARQLQSLGGPSSDDQKNDIITLADELSAGVAQGLVGWTSKKEKEHFNAKLVQARRFLQPLSRKRLAHHPEPVAEVSQESAAHIPDEKTQSAPNTPSYSEGVSLEPYASQERIAESPSERATELLNDIVRAWGSIQVNQKGERVVVSKKGKKELSWGDWLVNNVHDRIRSWSDKEKAYIRTNLPITAPNPIAQAGSQQSDSVIPLAQFENNKKARLEDEIAVLEKEIAELEIQMRRDIGRSQ